MATSNWCWQSCRVGNRRAEAAHASRKHRLKTSKTFTGEGEVWRTRARSKPNKAARAITFTPHQPRPVVRGLAPCRPPLAVLEARGAVKETAALQGGFHQEAFRLRFAGPAPPMRAPSMHGGMPRDLPRDWHAVRERKAETIV